MGRGPGCRSRHWYPNRPGDESPPGAGGFPGRRYDERPARSPFFDPTRPETRAMIRISAFADEISPDPVEQVDVLTKHGIRHIEFRSIHGTNVLDLTAPQHHAFRGLLRDRDFELSAIGSPI